MTQDYALISRRRNRSVKAAVGLLMILTVFIFLFFIWLSQDQLTPFSKTITFHSKISNAEHLQQGMPVMISGMVVGEVATLALQADRSIAITIRVNEKYHPMITTGTILKLSTSFIGSSKLKLETSKENLPRLEANGFLPFPNQDMAQELLAKLPEQIERIEAILENAEKITGMLSDESGPVVSSMKNLESTTKVLKTFIDNQMGAAGKMTQSMDQYGSALEQLSVLIQEVSQTVTEVRTPLTRLSPIMANIEDSTGLSVDSSSELKEILVRVNQNMDMVEKILLDLKSTTGQFNSITPEINRMIIETRNATDQASQILDAAQNSAFFKGAFPETTSRPVQSEPRIAWPLEGEKTTEKK